MKQKHFIRLSLLCAMLSFAVLANAQKFHYKYRNVDFTCQWKKGRIVITDFTRNAQQVVVPAIVDYKGKSYYVTSVSFFGETHKYKATTVALEKGIKVIDNYCFLGFPKLTELYIPSSVERIGKGAIAMKKMPIINSALALDENALRKGKPYVYMTAEEKQDPMAALDLTEYSTYDEIEEKATATPTIVEATPGTSDIDYNIPTGKVNRKNTFCVIIANEKYRKSDTPEVKFAAQDGKTFQNYCTKTLGIPSDNVKMVTNASYVDMKEKLEWLNTIARVYGGDANFIFYYAGHGCPDEKGNCKLMPVDVSINDVNMGYSLKELYDQFSDMNAKSALVLVDACFSGNDRNNQTAMDDKHRGIALKVKKEDVGGNVVVMTAASDSETALAYEEKAHGMFSYYLMKKLQETKGEVTLGELYDYVNQEVVRKSTVVKSKTQTPSITYSNKLADSWKQIKM